MGSMIYLSVGRLEVDWGKNNGFVDHSALFQSTDLSPVPYYYAGAEKADGENGRQWEIITEYKEGLSKPLLQVIDRINLLGHTPAVCEKEYDYLARLNGFDPDAFRFTDLQRALAAVDVGSLSLDYGEDGEDFGKFFYREISPRLKLSEFATDPSRGPFEFAQGMENLTAYTILHLLSGNPTAQQLPVQWAFNDVENGGWAKRDNFVRPVDQAARFLIVTEGSSDAAIIRQSFQLLKPHIADFFDYVDMEDGYPFTGTGNVFRFLQGLISISVLNNIIVVYDNDAEGAANFSRSRELKLPSNMQVVKLPDLPQFRNFPALGPNGSHIADINGQAAAIECYLQLPAEAQVRWTSFNSKLRAYQGELVNKSTVARNFLDQRSKMKDYDYEKILVVLNTIVKTAIMMRELVMAKAYDEEFEDRLSMT
ncbi:MAG: hypothetical protein GEU95_19260 [Rhizobiales bacterium]|nr:hypothetical protein [Hyphomicrobiales bacterium]